MGKDNPPLIKKGKGKRKLADHNPARRTCLGILCRGTKWMDSMGPGHRKCPRCLAAESHPGRGLSRRDCEVMRDTRGK